MKVLLLVALLLLILVAPAAAQDCGCDFGSGREFGQHVADMQPGHFDGEMNPGVMHQGFSPWAPGRE